MASKGVAITVGVNKVDLAQHRAHVPPLSGCHNDAKQMAAYLRGRGYTGPGGGDIPILLDADANSGRFASEVKRAADSVEDGDIFVLHASSHGCEMPDDASKDERDGKDSAIVLYDRLFLDDEMFNLWTFFKPGVRIVFVADMCHSGTMARPAPPSDPDDLDVVGVRSVPADVVKDLYQARESDYVKLRKSIAADRDGSATIQARLIQLAACQDTEVAFDLTVNGVFSRSLLEVLEKGSADRYASLLDQTSEVVNSRDLPKVQRPNLISVADPDPGLIAFMMQKPFTIEAP